MYKKVPILCTYNYISIDLYIYLSITHIILYVVFLEYISRIVIQFIYYVIRESLCGKPINYYYSFWVLCFKL